MGIGSVLVIAGFAAGTGWNVVGHAERQDVGKKAVLEKIKTPDICIPILVRQIRALETGTVAVRARLRALADKHCPDLEPLRSTGHPAFIQQSLDDLREVDASLAKAAR